MTKTTYQRWLDDLIESNQSVGVIPTLLLHSCCGPCSSYVLEYLSQYFHITVLYYNPNIYPADEYEFRKTEQKRLIDEMDFINPVEFIGLEHDESRYYESIKGLEGEPEGGDRCTVCYELRLREAAEWAKKLNIDYFATTLTISPMKDAARLGIIGAALEEELGVKYLYSDFKKKNGYKRSVELSREHEMYRQDYCGCVFSLNESRDRIARKE